VESRIQASLLKFERRVRATQNAAMGDGESRHGARSMRIDDLVRDAQDRAGVPGDRSRIAADTVDLKRVMQEATTVGRRVVPMPSTRNQPSALAIASALQAYAASFPGQTVGRLKDIRI